MYNSDKTLNECETIYLSFLIKHRRKPKPEELAQLLLEDGKSTDVISEFIKKNLRIKIEKPTGKSIQTD